MDELLQPGSHRALPLSPFRPCGRVVACASGVRHAQGPGRRAHAPAAVQRGGAATLALVLLMALALVVLAAKIFPTYGEYGRVQRVLGDVPAANPSSVAQARAAFEAQREAEDIGRTGPLELQLSRDAGMVVISFAYAREVPLVGPISLLVRYQGTVRKPARVPS